MGVNNSTVTPCQHLSPLLIVSVASVLNAGLKVPVLRSQRDCKIQNPRTDTARFTWLLFVCLRNKSVLQTFSVDLTVAGDDWRSAGGAVGAGFPFRPFQNWLKKFLSASGRRRTAGDEDSRETEQPPSGSDLTLLCPLYSDRASL